MVGTNTQSISAADRAHQVLTNFCVRAIPLSFYIGFGMCTLGHLLLRFAPPHLVLKRNEMEKTGQPQILFCDINNTSRVRPQEGPINYVNVCLNTSMAFAVNGTSDTKGGKLTFVRFNSLRCYVPMQTLRRLTWEACARHTE